MTVTGRLGVLGPLEVHCARGSVVPIRSLKVRTLLGALLLHVNRPMPIDALVDVLWGERPPRSAVKNLHSYVHRLRELLHGVGLAGRLSWDPGGYRLEAERTGLDLLDFEAATAEIGAASEQGRWEELVRLGEAALEHWRGPVLGDVGEVRAVYAAEIRRLDELRWYVGDELVRARMALGQSREVVPLLQVSLTERPYSEALRGRLMRALVRCGRKVDALEVYRETVRTFDDELGVRPGPVLRRLHEEILRDEPPAPRAQAEAVATSAPRHAPVQLPRDVATFVGHAEERETIARDLVAEDGPRAVVVSGPVGAGCTSLAVHVAHRVRDRFPGGVLFARLTRGTGSAPTRLVLREFLHCLGLPADGDDVDLLSARFRSRVAEPDRHVLLVLDGVTSAEQVRPMLPGSGRSAVLLTAPSGLPTLTDARHVRLSELDPEEGRVLLERVVGADRLAAEPAATREVLRFCDGLPLAIRAAGARLVARPGWRVAELRRRLADARYRVRELDFDGLSVRAATWNALRRPEDVADCDARKACAAVAAHDVTTVDADVLTAELGWPPARAGLALENLVDRGLLRCGDVPGRYRVPTLVRLALLAGDPAR
jgi:DNA-binding SARP family transcriptional activator